MGVAKEMNGQEKKYYNFKIGLGTRPTLLTWDEIKNTPIPAGQDAYVSIFAYNEEHKKRVDETGSVAGIKDVTTNALVWDFDNTNPEIARLDAVSLVERLVKLYSVDKDTIQCYYSGSKGVHVVLPISRTINPNEFKKATGEIAKDLPTFDPVVSDPARVLRLKSTQHQKTGLYKIALSVEDLMNLDMASIQRLAEFPDTGVKYKNNPATLPDNLFKVEEKKKLELVTEKTMLEDNSYDNPPKGWKQYKWALAQGWFEEGERHNALMVIAATARGLGYSKDHAYYLCKAALKKQALRTNTPEFDKAELWENIIEKSVYSDTWSGGQYSVDNNPWLKKYCERMNFDMSKGVDAVEITQLHNIEAEFVDFVKNIDKNTILTGIPELDEALPLTVGMNLGVIGAASSGKTALALKILKNTSDAGVVSVFASLDMRRNRLFEKLLYRVSGLSRHELYEKIKNDEAGPIFEQVKKEYANVYFYDRSCPTVEDIRSYIYKIEETTGKKVKLVMIDYFERVNADKSDDTAASKEVAGKLQDLVNDLNVCLITLVQPNKFSLSSGPDSPILNYTSIKGSSFLYQSFRSIISIWRPFFTPELKDHDKFLQMAILKNDLGELDLFNFGWDGKRGDIWGIGEEGNDELDRLLRMKEDSKKPTNATDSNVPWI